MPMSAQPMTPEQQAAWKRSQAWEQLQEWERTARERKRLEVTPGNMSQTADDLITKRRSRPSAWLVIFAIIGGLWLLSHVGDTSDPPTRTPENKIGKTVQKCGQAVECWAEEYARDAMGPCKSAIERESRYDVMWDNGNNLPFSRVISWADKNQTIISFHGHWVKFQNGFGAYERQSYFCDFDPKSLTVVKVTVAPRSLVPF
jgi:hypothetical protein